MMAVDLALRGRAHQNRLPCCAPAGGALAEAAEAGTALAGLMPFFSASMSASSCW